MSLEQKINDDIKAAMLAKEKEKLNALRAIKSAILLLKTETEGRSFVSHPSIPARFPDPAGVLTEQPDSLL